MFGEVVRGVSAEAFEDSLTEARRAQGAADDIELTEGRAETSDRPLPRAVHRAHGRDVPRGSPRPARTGGRRRVQVLEQRPAVTYRRLNGIPDELGTAVTVQRMVFGNHGTDSGSGVAFSRDPTTGAPEPEGDFLLSAQGEDVVAGVRNTEDLSDLARRMPEIHRQLIADLAQLEGHYRDMQDVEYGRGGRLFILQTRNAKRPAQAAVRFAHDAVGGLLDRAAALHTSTRARSRRSFTPPSTPTPSTPSSPAAWQPLPERRGA